MVDAEGSLLQRGGLGKVRKVDATYGIVRPVNTLRVSGSRCWMELEMGVNLPSVKAEFRSLAVCGGTGGSTGLRLLFEHEPSDHGVMFVVMRKCCI